MNVSICRGGCKPVYRGEKDECPECGATVRIAEVRE